MPTQRAALTPQMLQYDVFDDRSEARWMSYLMYFHRPNYHSDVINTDRLGFRLTHGRDDHASPGGRLPGGPVRLFAGSSTALGIGSTSDATTIPSRLWSAYAPATPWVNFSGRSYSSAQELLLFLLYRHLLPEIDEIVLFSGLNNLALARLPEEQRGDHGAFFYCGEFFDQMNELKSKLRKAKLGLRRRVRGGAAVSAADEAVPPLEERITYAAELHGLHLENWRMLAGDTKITFVMQSLATWVREDPSPQERLVFGELDETSNFWSIYGDIATKEAGRAYADELRGVCEKQGVTFIDINPLLAEAATEQDWLYVDRAHHTDHGHDIVAKLLADQLSLH
jgi:hypothetical protein